jgi:hypothetical protein
MLLMLRIHAGRADKCTFLRRNVARHIGKGLALGVERTFVDDPWASLEEADRVVADILAERNFPTDSWQEASKGVGAMHPQVVEDFREAQRVHRDATGSEGEAELEEMRRAIQMYRSVYERLTGG